MKSVYVIGCGERCHKIGISAAPSRRLLELQNGGPASMCLIASFPHRRARDVEHTAHRILHEARSRGEWFSVGEKQALDAVRAAIAHIDSGEAAPFAGVRARSHPRPFRPSMWRAFLTNKEAEKIAEIDTREHSVSLLRIERQMIANRALQRARYEERKRRGGEKGYGGRSGRARKSPSLFAIRQNSRGSMGPVVVGRAISIVRRPPQVWGSGHAT